VFAASNCRKLAGLKSGIDSWVRPPLASSEAVMGLLHRKFTTIQWELQQFDKNK
jgi:hypothetical protein